MKKYINVVFITFIILTISGLNNKLLSQCATNVSLGSNLVQNYDFSSDYTGWTHDPAYTVFTPCGSCYSVPGKIYVGTNPANFNNAFGPMNDHTPTADNKFLMVDGVCTLGIPLWQQTGIPIAPNTAYYFEVWITSLYGNAPLGSLRFDVNGTNLGTAITAPATVGTWIQFTAVWNSGPTPPPTATISIENTNTTGCDNAVDFGIDDITFTPGCSFASAGPTPNLGPDRTLCGTGGSITLNAGVTPSASLQVAWNDGVSGSGMGAPYSRTISTAGTYSVCVRDGASCWKSDVVVISATYSINLGPDIVLCNPTTATLDAIYTGPGVTYQWSKNGTPISGATARTYTATSTGTYSVSVTDPICGTRSDAVVISTQAANPTDGTYCPVASGGTGIANLSVSGSGTYQWFNNPTGGTSINSGTTYNPSGLVAPGPYTYYVEDISTFSLTVGPPATGHGFIQPANVNAGNSQGLLVFGALTAFRLDQISVLVNNYWCPTPGAANNNVIIEIRDAGGAHLPGSPVSVTKPCNIQNNGGLPAEVMTIPIGIDIPAGTGYQMRLAAGSGNSILMFLNGTGAGGAPPVPRRYVYPTTYSGVVEFTANSATNFNLYYSPDAFPGYFDWQITKGINCQRVPVTARLQCPLPVELLSFSAIAKGNSTQLSWTTAVEENSYAFEIERSFDGITFSKLAQVFSTGSNSTYSYSDPRVGKSSTVYYRLKMKDIDGSFSYSNVKSIEWVNDHTMQIIPNPTSGSVEINFTSEDRVVEYLVYNSLGQQIIQGKNIGSGLVYSEQLDLSSFAVGVYTLILTTENASYANKIVKQ